MISSQKVPADYTAVDEFFGIGPVYVVAAAGIAEIGHCEFEFWTAGDPFEHDNELYEDIAVCVGRSISRDDLIMRLRRLASRLLSTGDGRLEISSPADQLIKLAMAPGRAEESYWGKLSDTRTLEGPGEVYLICDAGSIHLRDQRIRIDRTIRLDGAHRIDDDVVVAVSGDWSYRKAAITLHRLSSAIMAGALRKIEGTALGVAAHSPPRQL